MEMPASPDSRAGAAGNMKPVFGRPEYAAEFLRRNRRYQTDYAKMSRMIATGAVNEPAARQAFARRWGLSFRLCPC